MSTKLWLTLGALAAVCVGGGALVVFSWTISETHFDRPDEGFDRLAAQVEGLPGVSVDGSERWVEAPVFLDPSSWIGVSVDEPGLPGLLDTACASPYPDDVLWSLRVLTDGGNVVTVGSPAEGAVRPGRCLEVGLDPLGLAGRIDGAVRGVELYASTRVDGRLALTALDGPSGGMTALLPIVAGADELRDAAGVDPSALVEIGGSTLVLVVEPGESERYRALLARLVDDHGVTGYYADGGGTPIDGVEKVQIVAPDDQHAAIEAAVRDSGLHIADLPVRFLEP